MQSLESAPEPSLLSADSTGAPAPSGPWILACSYCNWSSAEIGVKFEKPQGISAQLSKLRDGSGRSAAGEELHHQQHHHHHQHSHGHGRHHHHQSRYSISGGGSSGSGDISPTKMEPIDTSVPETTKARFSALKAFYQAQLAATSPGAGFPSALGGIGMGDYGFNSPGTLSRIMSLYSGAGGGAAGGSGGRQKGRVSTMREAETAGEGLRVSDLDEEVALARLRRGGWDGTVALEQARSQVEEGGAGRAAPRFADDLWPVPYLLRSKRSKRCPVCRHIISRPESKVGNTRWRIRLVANNYIPSISIRRLLPGSSHSSGGGGGSSSSSNPHHPSNHPSNHPGGSGSSGSHNNILTPLRPAQFLLTFKNPIFEEVRVTLATPAVTPGRFASRVTLLCPQFSIGANIEDMDLDDVLSSSKDASAASFRGTSGAAAAPEGETAGTGTSSGTTAGGRPRGNTAFSTFSLGEDGGAEPGKIWERGRNWVSVVVEVVPASLKSLPPLPNPNPDGSAAPPPPAPREPPLAEDEDVLEIPVFVRLEWEGEASHDQVGGGVKGSSSGSGAGVGAADKDGREKKELAYWCALGIGRISQT